MAKKRSVGSARPTHAGGEIALLPAGSTRDLPWLEPPTFHGSLPDTTFAPPLSVQSAASPRTSRPGPACSCALSPKLGERLRQRLVAAVLRGRGEHARACGRGNSAVVATSEIAATTRGAMSPFIEMVPSIGSACAPKVGALRKPTRSNRRLVAPLLNGCPAPHPHWTPQPSGESKSLWNAASSRSSRRELLFVLPFALSFALAAIGLAVFADPARALSVPVLVAFIVAYARRGADRVLGRRRATPCRRSSCSCRCCCCCRRRSSRCSSAAARAGSPSRPARRAPRSAAALLALGDAWFALGPAIVLVALGAQLPDLALLAGVRWLALAAQLVVDAVAFAARGSARRGGDAVAGAGRATCGSSSASTCCSRPIGLLAAIAAADAPAAALLVLAADPAAARLRARARGPHRSTALELGRAYRGTALLLRDLLEEDDEYTGRHTEDVVGLTVAVAERMGVDEDTRRAAELGRAAARHRQDRRARRDHQQARPAQRRGVGDHEDPHRRGRADARSRSAACSPSVGVVVRASHERWDGGGYPDGLAGEAIPVAARIVSACDAFNAMTTDRSYRKALPLEVAIGELRANAGTQFAPDVVDALVAVVTRDAPDWQLSISEPAASGIEAQPQPVKQP